MHSTIPVSKKSKPMSEYLVLQRGHQWEMLPLQSLRGDPNLWQPLVSDLSQQPLQETGRGFLGRHKTKPNTCQFTKQKNKRVCYCKSSLPLPPVKPGIYKTKECIKEFCVMEYLSLSVCRLKTTLPDQALPWQFRSSKAFNILSSHRERSHHKQLNSAWHLSRRWEMQKSQVLVEGAALQGFSGHGRRLSSVHAHKWTLHLLHKECSRNWPIFFFHFYPAVLLGIRWL